MQIFRSAAAVCLFILHMALYPDFAQLRWHKRVLAISAVDADGKALQEQERLLAGGAKGIADRDIQIIRVIGDDPEAEKFRVEWKIDRLTFAVLLIGKDGFVKLLQHAPLSVVELFQTVDSMPMRQEEMKRTGRDRKQ